MTTRMQLDLLDSILNVVDNPDYRDDDARMAEIRRLVKDAE